MPYISDKERAELEKDIDKCKKCKKMIRKLYCNICDEFWFKCDCPIKKDRPGSFYKNDHSDCRR